MPNDAVGNATHQQSSCATQPSTPHYYQASAYLVCQSNNLLDGTSQPNVCLCHLAASSFDLFYFSVQSLLSFVPCPFRAGAVSNSQYFTAMIDLQRDAPNKHNVQFRASLVSYIGCGSSR